MSDKFLTRSAIAAFATLILAVLAVAGITYFSPKAPPATSNTQLTALTNGQAVTHIDPIVRDSQTSNPGSDQPATQPQAPAFSLPLSNAVGADDLKNLAVAVDLKNAKLSDVDKEAWQKALPTAQKLLQGACDCEGRNWLNHFVETGNYALSGDSHYEDSAKMLLTLPKNDDEATTHKISSN